MTSRCPASSLPPFVLPMLARPGAPFDSEEHLFEIKWDGTRMLAFVEQDGIRLINRHQAERTVQYPELSCLTELPAGTILDGELVVFADGRPDRVTSIELELKGGISSCQVLRPTSRNA